MRQIDEQELYIFLLCLINKGTQQLILKNSNQHNLDSFLAYICFDKNRFFDWSISNITYTENGDHKEKNSYPDFSKGHHEDTKILSMTIDLSLDFIKNNSDNLRKYLKEFVMNQVESKSIPLFKSHLNGFINFLESEKNLLNKNNVILSSDSFAQNILGISKNLHKKYKPRFLDFIALLWFIQIIELNDLSYRTIKRETISIYEATFKLIKDSALNINYFLDHFGIEHKISNSAEVKTLISTVEYSFSTKQLTINTEKGFEVFSFKDADSQRKTLETFFYLLNEDKNQPWSYELVIETRMRLYKGSHNEKNIKNDIDNIKKKVGTRKKYLGLSKNKSGWMFSPQQSE